MLTLLLCCCHKVLKRKTQVTWQFLQTLLSAHWHIPVSLTHTRLTDTYPSHWRILVSEVCPEFILSCLRQSNTLVFISYLRIKTVVTKQAIQYSVLNLTANEVKAARTLQTIKKRTTRKQVHFSSWKIIVWSSRWINSSNQGFTDSTVTLLFRLWRCVWTQTWVLNRAHSQWRPAPLHPGVVYTRLGYTSPRRRHWTSKQVAASHQT